MLTITGNEKNWHCVLAGIMHWEKKKKTKKQQQKTPTAFCSIPVKKWMILESNLEEILIRPDWEILKKYICLCSSLLKVMKGKDLRTVPH